MMISGLLLVWAAAIMAGMRMLWKYQTTPNLPAAAPLAWPKTTSVRRIPGLRTLVMFAHPQCPCTRASIEELDLLTARLQGRIQTVVLSYKPQKFPDEWRKTDLWRHAAKILGVTVFSDPDGREARRFGAWTSGQVLLYDANGTLLYSGGLTGARGHVGANKGFDAVISLVTTGKTLSRKAMVFGCSLFDPAPAPKETP